MERREEEWELIAKYIANECTEEEYVQFESWLQSSEENKKNFEAVSSSLERLQKSELEEHPNPEQVWQRIQGDLSKPSGENNVRPLLRNLSIAASVLLVLGLSLYFFRNKGIPTEELVVEQNISDQVKEIALEDGSKIWLNAKSSLAYPKNFNGKKRLVVLKGEAFFDIERDINKPFVIEVGDGSVEVLGTSFNIDASRPDKAILVNVESGKVSFGNGKGSKPLILKKGDQGIMSAQDGRLVKLKNYDPNMWSWKTGILRFKESKMDYVIPHLEKYYGVTIRSTIPKAKYDALRFTSTLDHQELSVVVSTLSYSLDINILNNGSELIFAEK